MTRRALVLAVPQVMLQRVPDEFEPLRKPWNEFADKLNRGVVDYKAWGKVVAAVQKIDGRKCK